MNETKLFIFDCDGTLLDTIGAWHDAEMALVEEVGVTLSKEQRDELNALTLEEASAFFHERFGIRGSAQEVMQAILDLLDVFYRTRSQANPGAFEFVRALAESGVPMCVLSSSPHAFIQSGLERAGLLPYMQRAISVEDLGMTKRDVATYAHVCSEFGVEPGETWFFDDSWYALETAREAGCKTVGVYSTDACGTHDELGRYSHMVIDTFEGLDPALFLGAAKLD